MTLSDFEDEAKAGIETRTSSLKQKQPVDCGGVKLNSVRPPSALLPWMIRADQCSD